ncbi:ATP-dependent helicase, partial [Listeria monocytogenes]|nr:ATP-dependent helicase [Listeria monocytogenes]
QSIYMWRGAYPEAFKSIWEKENFEKIFMGDNFRSCQQIQNYTNILCEETRSLYKSVKSLENIIWINIDDTSSWEQQVLKEIDNDQSSALLRFRVVSAKEGASALSTFGLNYVFIPQLPIADITTETSWLYSAISKFCILEHYSVYDLVSDIPVEAD